MSRRRLPSLRACPSRLERPHDLDHPLYQFYSPLPVPSSSLATGARDRCVAAHAQRFDASAVVAFVAELVDEVEDDLGVFVRVL